MSEIKILSTTSSCYPEEVRSVARDTLCDFGKGGAFAIGSRIICDRSDDNRPYIGQNTLIYRDLKDDIQVDDIENMAIPEKMKFGGPSFVMLSTYEVTDVALASYTEMMGGEDPEPGTLLAFQDGLLIMSIDPVRKIMSAIEDGATLQESAEKAFRIVIPNDLSAHRRILFLQEVCAFARMILTIDTPYNNKRRDSLFKDIVVYAK